MAFIYLRAHANGKIVQAVNSGGGDLRANAGLILEWESFVLTDLTGQTPQRLCANDVIGMRASNGQYVCAELAMGPEFPLAANRGALYGWEQFQVVSLEGIPAGSPLNYSNHAEATVALRAANGRWVCAEDYGNGRLNANREGIGGWETFSIGFSGANRERPSFSTWRNLPAIQ
jgi:hypothetical protein